MWTLVAQGELDWNAWQGRGLNSIPYHYFLFNCQELISCGSERSHVWRQVPQGFGFNSNFQLHWGGVKPQWFKKKREVATEGHGLGHKGII